MTDYARMTSEELVEHFIDDNGLAPFIDLQQKGVPFAEWDWRSLAVYLQAFSRGYLTFSPEYLEELYEMQAQRIASKALEIAAA